uniref:HAT C-terminal dimerisation domain-containing protein n=1 Tax=Amphimedon queenslandica TaxID=400682 RepID=A0A1X7SF34_AMPQE
MTSPEVGSTGIDNSAGNSGSSTQSIEPSQSLWNTFDRSVAESTSHRHRNTGTDCIIEVRRYFEEPNTSRSSNPLDWWKNNSSKYPRLHKVASKYLGVPGSSVPSERLFSKAGKLVRGETG